MDFQLKLMLFTILWKTALVYLIKLVKNRKKYICFVAFPAGILQGVFFHKDRPRYMNFGAVGSVIGHEITHGFDDTGRQFDKDGNLVNWWKEETKIKFLEKAQCIIRQYNNYTVPEVKLKVEICIYQIMWIC